MVWQTMAFFRRKMVLFYETMVVVYQKRTMVSETMTFLRREMILFWREMVLLPKRRFSSLKRRPSFAKP
jgi:hypothetical protein